MFFIEVRDNQTLQVTKSQLHFLKSLEFLNFKFQCQLLNFLFLWSWLNTDREQIQDFK